MEEYTVVQVAAILGVSRQMVLKYITTGYHGVKLNAKTYRNRYIITKSDLDYFINRCFERSMFQRYWNM